MTDAWRLRIPERLHQELLSHLFRDDFEEHGAIIAAGLLEGERGVVLLARELHPAVDGVDFVPGRRGHRRLTAQFVNAKIRHCRDEGLVYLAVHNHFGSGSVSFSDIDLESHERGYPALLDISGRPVGALVLTEDAVAGDIWTPDRRRRQISETLIVGANLRRLHPGPPPTPPASDETYDRAVRIFGDRGQDIFARTKVGVIGGGGVGQLVVSYLARLGVGEILLVEPERLDLTNLPRIPEARRIDALALLYRVPALRGVARRFALPKTRLARRVAKRANPKIRFCEIRRNVVEPEAREALRDSDFLFNCADSHQARLIANVIANQYLVPMIQVGTRIEVDEDDGEVGEIRGMVRLVLPDRGCLYCHGLINSQKLQEESQGEEERERNRYIKEVEAPSVITLNAHGAAQATTDFMLMMGGLIEDDARLSQLRWRPRKRLEEPVSQTPNRSDCPHCGSVLTSRRARGDARDLPGPERRA
jgi:molybdopterin/thiamine biosynthesis adenylyltransferase